jgi:Stage II sporulation protein E (SpoIIE)
MTFLGKSSFWIKTLLATGTALAIALVAQTVVNYRYVSNSLIQQEARRVAAATVRDVERAARLSHPQDSEAFRILLADVRGEQADQLAGLVLRREDGTAVAADGESLPATGPDGRPQVPAAQAAPFTREWRSGREILVGAFPCRCGVSGAADAAGRPRTLGRSLLEVALYGDSLSAPFARLRRNTIINASAALMLLVSLALIVIRFGPYVQGKQLEAQMDLARDVQRELLPAAESWPAGLDVAAECIPALRVGGDFYDIVTLPAGRLAFALGDVSGHGVSAALLLGLIQGSMSSPPWGVLTDEADRAASLNELLLTKSSGNRFASLFWCSYDPALETLRYINAGHLPPLWIRRPVDGTPVVDRLAEGGPVLGLLADASYRTASTRAGAGDLLVLFSDGVVEATNDRDEYFGEDRLIAVTQQSLGLPALAIRDAILSAVRTFAGNRAVQDDQTLLVVRLPATDQRGARRA